MHHRLDIKQDRQGTCDVVLIRVRSTFVAKGKATRITYSECAFVALGF